MEELITKQFIEVIAKDHIHRQYYADDYEINERGDITIMRGHQKLASFANGAWDSIEISWRKVSIEKSD